MEWIFGISGGMDFRDFRWNGFSGFQVETIFGISGGMDLYTSQLSAQQHNAAFVPTPFSQGLPFPNHNSDLKYTHTAYNKVPDTIHPTCGIFLKRGLFNDIKNDIPMSQTCKCNNTNTQIHKYTITSYDEVPERPNMWYIFEKRIVQGYH